MSKQHGRPVSDAVVHQRVSAEEFDDHMLDELEEELCVIRDTFNGFSARTSDELTALSVMLFPGALNLPWS